MRKGFSLVEVLVTIVIVGFALIATIHMFSVAGRGSESAENLATATNLAQGRIEEIRHLVQNGITVDVGHGTYSFDGTTLPNVVKNDVVYFADSDNPLYLTELDLAPEKKLGLPGTVDRVAQLEWVEGVDTYKKVQVTIFWFEKGEPLSCGFVTYIRN